MGMVRKRTGIFKKRPSKKDVSIVMRGLTSFALHINRFIQLDENRHGSLGENQLGFVGKSHSPENVFIQAFDPQLVLSWSTCSWHLGFTQISFNSPWFRLINILPSLKAFRGHPLWRPCNRWTFQHRFAKWKLALSRAVFLAKRWSTPDKVDLAVLVWKPPPNTSWKQKPGKFKIKGWITCLRFLDDSGMLEFAPICSISIRVSIRGVIKGPILIIKGVVAELIISVPIPVGVSIKHISVLIVRIHRIQVIWWRIVFIPIPEIGSVGRPCRAISKRTNYLQQI